MHAAGKLALAVSFCAIAATGAVYGIAMMDPSLRPSPRARARPHVPREVRPVGSAAAEVPKPLGTFLDQEPLDDGGLAFALVFTGPIRDPSSLPQLAEAIRTRGPLGREVIAAELSQLHLGPNSPRDRLAYGLKLRKTLGLLAMHDGLLDEATAAFVEAERLAAASGSPWKDRLTLIALRGIAALRKGEVGNCVACVGPSSCIFPIAPDAKHLREEGSREAIRLFSAYLDELPGDVRVRWLLNLAYMTLGEHPEKVPARDLVSIEGAGSRGAAAPWANVAVEAGLTGRGPNQAGGSVFDDFTGDGRPDILSTSLDADRGASLWVNRGDGTFEDRSRPAGLDDQVYALNITRADFDNDGDLDVLLLRGAWEKPMRMSLLRNRGDATFEDVTVVAGLGTPISSESAAWGDFDHDGLLDVFVCGELRPPKIDPATFRPDPRNRSRLYRNRGDGTFEDVAAKAGLGDEGFAKGAAWGDYDDDGRPDLFVSNMTGASRLYHNEGDGTFRDRAPELGVRPALGFACWFWDYDNDGRLDLFVNPKGNSFADEVAAAQGMPTPGALLPSLYRNLGPHGFRDVTREVGLDRVMTPMGCNFGDVDNDGFQDLYFGTGGMAYAHLVPNLMFKNLAGRAFEDITASSRTGHLQKGHGVSFADYDGDGALDFFVEAGGAVPGDHSHNLLFRNPSLGGNWLGIKLRGTRSNRSAIGAKVRAVVRLADGSTRAAHRTIGNNSSFGGNSLVEHIGLGERGVVEELSVRWPDGGEPQVFRDVDGGRVIEITEGVEGFRAAAHLPGAEVR